MNSFSYRLRFSKTGRARFIAHLDTLACLVRAVRRAGYDLAQTQGMRPKPLLSLAMPLGVGVEGEDEICDFELKQRVPLTEFAKKLSRELPEGIELKSVGPCLDRTKSAARVARVSYRVALAGPPVSAGALKLFAGSPELKVIRHRPKGDKEVDVKKYVSRVEASADGGSLTFDMAVTDEGTARPEEVISLLEGFSGAGIEVARVTRTAIELKEEKPPAPPARGRRGRFPARRR